MTNMKRNLKKEKAFTLIELLIVIGILSILAITVLLALNPGEAQKKNRDLKRVRDAGTLQTIIDQFLNDGHVPTGCLISTNGCNSKALAVSVGGNGPIGVAPQPCNGTGNANWLQTNVCDYTQTVPVDSLNRQPVDIVSFDGSAITMISITTAMGGLGYKAKVSGNDYEINVAQESKSNANKVFNDNGNNNDWLEVGVDLTMTIP